MGIADLNQVIAKHAPSAVATEVPLGLFFKTRIAIDAQLWIFAVASSASSAFVANEATVDELKRLARRQTVARLKAFIAGAIASRFRELVGAMKLEGITPVMVFDGTAVPEKTSGARAKRHERREAIAERTAAMADQLDAYASLLETPDEDISAMRRLLRQASLFIPSEVVDVAKAAAAAARVPVVVAPDEAEKFAAWMTIERYASAVMTKDTDVFAIGARAVIVDINITEMTATVVCSPAVCRGLGLTQSQLTELCILLGCDFNSRPAKFGPVKAVAAIKALAAAASGESRLIEAGYANGTIPYETEAVNAERCRQIFTDMTACVETYAALQQSLNMPGVEVPVDRVPVKK